MCQNPLHIIYAIIYVQTNHDLGNGRVKLLHFNRYIAKRSSILNDKVHTYDNNKERLTKKIQWQYLCLT